MSSPNDPLAGLYADEEDQVPQEQEDPLAGLYADEEAGQTQQSITKKTSQPSQYGASFDDRDLSEPRYEDIAGIASKEGWRGVASGLTFGLSENVPGLAPKDTGGDFAAGQVLGSLAPIGALQGALSKPLLKLAAKSPVLTNQLTSFANITGWGLTGAADKALHDVAKGEVPNSEDLLVHGAEWAALDAGLQSLGLVGRFASALARKVSKIGQPTKTVLNETIQAAKAAGEGIGSAETTAAKALEILEQTPPINAQDLRQRKVSDLSLNQLERESPVLAEPYNPGEISFEREIEQLERSPVRNEIEAVAERAESDVVLGESIKKSVNENLEEAKKAYKPLYAIAEESAETINDSIPAKTGFVATETLKDVNELSTRATGYTTVINTIESVLKDSGFKIQRDEVGKVIEAISVRDVPVKNLMKLGRRINEIIDYDVVERTVKDHLRPIARAVKSDIRVALAEDPAALRAFETAEAKYAETAERFSTDRIRKIRGEASPEKIAKEINTSSGLREIRQTVSPKQYAQVEREVLERMDRMSHGKAADYLRNVERELSKESQKLARKIVEAKAPNSAMFRRKQVQQAVLDDLSNALSTGERPSKTLKLWKTPEGQKIVRESLQGSPNAAKVERYLQNQSLHDFASSFVKPDGKIDFKKFRELIKDPATVENLRRVGGEDAVQFFRDIEGRVQQLDINLGSQRETLPRHTPTTKPADGTGVRGKEILKGMSRKEYPLKSIMDDALNALGIEGRTTLSVFGIMKYGFKGGALAVIGKEMLYRLAKSKAARAGFRRAARKGAKVNEIMTGLKAMDEALRDEDTAQ